MSKSGRPNSIVTKREKLVKQIALSEKLTAENEVLRKNFTEASLQLTRYDKVTKELQEENQVLKKKLEDINGYLPDNKKVK